MGASVLDIDNIARIGLLFIDGDKFENVLIDKLSLDFDDINYFHDDFMELKVSLLKLSLINPDMDIKPVLWQPRPDNPRMAVPVVIGTSLPKEGPIGTDVVDANPEVYKTYTEGTPTVKKREDGSSSYYYAVKNSDNDVVGALELLVGSGEPRDI